MKILSKCAKCKRRALVVKRHKMFFKPINRTVTGKDFICRTCTRKIENKLSENIN